MATDGSFSPGGGAGDGVDFEESLLCDLQPSGDTIQFYRRIVRDAAGVFTVTNTDHDGDPYTVTGAIVSCLPGEDSDFDEECVTDVLPNGQRLMVWRRTIRGEDGTFTTTLVDGTGAPYAQQGALQACSTDIDRESACWRTTAGGDTVFHGTIRHDDSLVGQPGTEFGWALYSQNQTQVPATTPGLTFVDCTECCDTAVIDSGCWTLGTESGRFASMRAANGDVTVIDTTTGAEVDAAATLDECEDCCATQIGEGCWNDGTSSGTWVSLRANDGTITIIDPTTGATVDPADIGECPRPQYSTSINTVENTTFVVPGGGTNLVSWAVRARTPGAQLTVGGTTVTLDDGEVVESSTQDDTGTLQDSPTIVAGAGESVRVTWLSRA